MRTHPLVQADALRTALQGDSPPLVFDTGFDLSDRDAGRRAHADGHIPGAHYLHLEDDLSGPITGRTGRHPLPERAAFAATAGRFGIAPGRSVVVYDRHGGMYAARAWWLLRWLGHADVCVLDGGMAAWTAAGGDLQREPPAPLQEAGPYPMADKSSRTAGSDAPRGGPAAVPATPPAVMPTIDADGLQRRIGDVVLLDARAPERFRGDVEPLDAQAGHIPGARNRPFKDNLGPDGRFKPAAALRDEFLPLLGRRPATEVVHQCGSGVTACHNLLAMELAGLGGSALYPGSWSEWSSDPARPVAVG